MAAHYKSPDELPYDTYGVEDSGDEEEGMSDEEEEVSRVSSGRIPSTSGEFAFEFWESHCDLPNFAQLYGKMWRADSSEAVGCISADLLCSRRPGLYGVCDDHSEGLISMARVVITDRGGLRDAMRSAIGDERRIRAASTGGLLHLEEVHIKRSYRGRDLGLELVMALFAHLGRRFSLAVALVVPWDYADQAPARLGPLGRSAEEKARLCRHFARAGLRELGTGSLWFVERELIPTEPLPKAAVAALEPSVRADRPVPPRLCEQDEQLNTIVSSASVPVNYLAMVTGLAGPPNTDMILQLMLRATTAFISTQQPEMLRLLRAGANADRATAAHVATAAAADERYWSPAALLVLLGQGGASVNHADPMGNTALHVAADIHAEAPMRVLLESGADPLARNAGGERPLDRMKASARWRLQAVVDHFGNGEMAAMLMAAGRQAPGAECVRDMLPAAHLMLRATAARAAQREPRRALVHALMYNRRLTPDVLRKIHGAVEPPPSTAYPSLAGLLEPGTPVALSCLGGAQSLYNGRDGVLLRRLPSGHYEVRVSSALEDRVAVAPEQVLPLDAPLQR